MAQKKENMMATPVNILWENVLMVPIFGTLDSARAQELLETMLTKIQEVGSKTMILDILGVATVDTAVANHLIKMTKATKLMGCECIVSGVSPSVAQTMVDLGVEMGGVITTSTLHDALGAAFDTMGLEVRKVQKTR